MRRLGFIGSGNIASAIIRGIVEAKLTSPKSIMVTNKQNRERLERLCTTYGVTPATLEAIASSCDVMVLAVKPHQVDDVLNRLQLASSDQCLISVAAGVSLKHITSRLSGNAHVVRAMPNTPACIGQGVTALCGDAELPAHMKEDINAIFRSVGEVVWVEEDLMDVVTALSGSGPAYFFKLAQEMAHSAAELGLPEETAEKLACYTLAGAGSLARARVGELDKLIAEVTSPNGTTQAALRTFDKANLSLAVRQAMYSAKRRAFEMSLEVDGAVDADRSFITRARRIVVKVGSSTVTDKAQNLNREVLKDLARQISYLMQEGKEVVLVSSGAVAAGRGKIGLYGDSLVSEKQVLAAVGQGLLMSAYEAVFADYGIPVAQVLLTKDDIDSARRCNLCRSTLENMLSRKILPIVNENDTVAVDEIRFGDNDTLSAQVARLVSADLLILLSDIDGFYTKDPRKDSSARLLRVITDPSDELMALAGGSGSRVGTGGMVTKLIAARIALEQGIPTIIANGSAKDVLISITSGHGTGTLVTASAAER